MQGRGKRDVGAAPQRSIHCTLWDGSTPQAGVMMNIHKTTRPPVVLRQASIGASHGGATLAVALLPRAI